MAVGNYTWREHLRALESFDEPGESWRFEFDDVTPGIPGTQTSQRGNDGIYRGNTERPVDDKFEDFEPVYDYRSTVSDQDVVDVVRKKSRTTQGNRVMGVFIGLMFIAMTFLMIFVFSIAMKSSDSVDNSVYTGYEKVTAKVVSCNQNSTGSYDVLTERTEGKVKYQQWLNEGDTYIAPGKTITFYYSEETGMFSMTDPSVYVQEDTESTIGTKIVFGVVSISFLLVGLLLIITSLKHK